MRCFLSVGLGLVALWAGSSLLAAGKHLVVGTHEAPPFVIKDAKDGWSGLSIDLWKQTAEQLGLDYEFREVATPEALIDGIKDGTLDASIAAITVTEERAKKVDFTVPFFNSGLGIVVPASSGGLWQVVKAFFSLDFLKVVAALGLVLLAAGFGVWFFERKRNADQFGGSPARGLAAAFWWAGVTMTTVGYGDKAPQTVGGRVIAMIWMFTGVIMISGFTAQIASSLTVTRLNTEIKGPADLPRFAIITVRDSSAARYLHARNVVPMTSDNVADAVSAVSSGTADACVYDSAILKYELRRHHGLTLLPATFDLSNYAIALPLKSPLRKPMNLAVLNTVQGDVWPVLLRRYLGNDD
ncbi:transporter substrate-binding domain-containing protein [Horticoccus luteus]|uniref:Transporter substrate-binding domain-containing protein n=1 Tax=Horticoccus luteus TaxID=2862869 RepID=A0A8F9TVX1_9BACT|nr:transporter substrate-binding domain-containing protein [Horticoccus luteus]QYM78738.1 transporter substrate-binding domain-containing protein [Horticoccus luteus]